MYMETSEKIIIRLSNIWQSRFVLMTNDDTYLYVPQL